MVWRPSGGSHVIQLGVGLNVCWPDRPACQRQRTAARTGKRRTGNSLDVGHQPRQLIGTNCSISFCKRLLLPLCTRRLGEDCFMTRTRDDRIWLRGLVMCCTQRGFVQQACQHCVVSSILSSEAVSEAACLSPDLPSLICTTWLMGCELSLNTINSHARHGLAASACRLRSCITLHSIKGL